MGVGRRRSDDDGVWVSLCAVVAVVISHSNFSVVRAKASAAEVKSGNWQLQSGLGQTQANRE